jgi:hypothetical protein
MNRIIYMLTDVAAVDSFVSTKIGHNKWSDSSLPPTLNKGSGAMYVIHNYGTDNRYVGRTDNLKNRFGGRLGVCWELGLDQKNLKGIYVHSGKVVIEDPNRHEIVDYTDNGVKVTVGKKLLNLENVLIRAFMAGFKETQGQYNTNTKEMSTFKNETGDELEVEFHYGKTDDYEAGVMVAKLQSGKGW